MCNSKSGKVQGIDGEQAYRRLMEKTQARTEAFNDLDEIRAYIAEDDPDAADRVVGRQASGDRRSQVLPQNVVGAAHLARLSPVPPNPVGI